jgi:hypothetical protein
MKKKFVITPLLVLFSLITQAQFFNKSKSASTDTVAKQSPAQLFTQLVNSVKPTSFTSSFAKQKKTLLEDIDKAKDPALVAKNISTLASFIKPAMFKKDFSTNNLLKPSIPAATMPQAMEMLKDLESGLNPAAMASSWNFLKKAVWISDVNKVK